MYYVPKIWLVRQYGPNCVQLDNMYMCSVRQYISVFSSTICSLYRRHVWFIQMQSRQRTLTVRQYRSKISWSLGLYTLELWLYIKDYGFCQCQWYILCSAWVLTLNQVYGYAPTHIFRHYGSVKNWILDTNNFKGPLVVGVHQNVYYNLLITLYFTD